MERILAQDNSQSVDEDGDADNDDDGINSDDDDVEEEVDGDDRENPGKGYFPLHPTGKGGALFDGWMISNSIHFTFFTVSFVCFVRFIFWPSACRRTLIDELQRTNEATEAGRCRCLQHIQDDDDFFDDNDHDDVMMIVMIMIVMTIAVKFLQDVCLQQV